LPTRRCASGVIMSDLLTVAEVAALFNVSNETVTRRFAKERGVIDLGNPGNLKRRRYRVLRIPRVVVERYVLTRGGRIAVPEPTPVPREPRKTVTPTEDDLTRDLALLATQHGAAARQTLEHVLRRARAMTFVPADLWDLMVWLDDDE